MKTMDKIKTLRIKNGYSQEELGKIIGVQKAAINKYETGRVVNIKRSTLQKLATALDVKPIELFDDEEIVSVSKSDIKSTKSVMIPILNEIVAGMPIDAYEDIIGYEEISKSLADTGEFFALKVKGDSMLPKLENGDIVIVRRQSCVESGDIAIVLVGDEATVKKVQKSETGITLIAYNPTVYEPHTYSNEEINQIPIKIMGKVVESKRSY